MQKRTSRSRNIVHLLLVTLLTLITILLLSSCQEAQLEVPMVEVPAGKFIMGSDGVDTLNKAKEFGARKPWYEDEQPMRTMELKAFKIDKYEVTNEQYARFVRETKRKVPDHWTEGTVPKDKADHPVIYVNWQDADEFCKWAGKRLPTELEWEKAARGPNGNEFPWGASFDAKKTNTGQDKDTASVTKYKTDVSAFGVFGMGGNVMEWTSDWYLPYPDNKKPNKYYGKTYKVTRGGGGAGIGGHYLIDHYYRSAYRRFFPPERKFGDLGFRCAANTDVDPKI